MAMTSTQFIEQINVEINRALASGLTVAQIIAALNAQVTAITGSPVVHDRTIEDPGAALNPSQP